MVAIVHQSSSLKNALLYNENKVKQKMAELIHAGNYPKDTELLSFTERFNRLQKQAELNIRTKVNSVHISLNFDETDMQKLDKEKLRIIADTYMQKIGFGDQPYLVYQHTDAGHPHLHLVTTNIRNDGKRIALHNLARNQSLKAAKEIEQEFKLAVATDRMRPAYQLNPINTLKIQYGKSETRRAITNVLDHVLPQYKYTSVPELNAVLKLYNVVADMGTKDSRIAKNGGLVYHVLNDKGEKMGVPIKASLIYNKPTLKFLQEKFAQNEPLRQQHKQHIKNTIDFTIKKQPDKMSINQLSDELKKEGINLVTRQNKEGRIYGITYIDHKSKSVFNGSDLGKPYAAAGLLERLDNPTINEEQQLKQQQKIVVEQKQGKQNISANKEQSNDLSITTNQSIQKALDILFKEEYNGSLAIELQNEMKRKKRKRLRQQ